MPRRMVDGRVSHGVHRDHTSPSRKCLGGGAPGRSLQSTIAYGRNHVTGTEKSKLA